MVSKNTDLDKFTKCDVFTPDNISSIMTEKLKSEGSLIVKEQLNLKKCK